MNIINSLPLRCSVYLRILHQVPRLKLYGKLRQISHCFLPLYESIHRTSTTFCLLADSDEHALAQLPAERKVRLGTYATTALIGSPETIRQRLAAYEEAGVQELVLRFVNGTNLEAIRRFAREFIM